MMRRLTPLLYGAVLAMAMCAPGVAHDAAGYEIWFAGKVLSVDIRGGRLRVAHGPTETLGRGVEDCVLRGPGLAHLHAGMEILAQVDSRRHPWRVLHLRVLYEVRPAPSEQKIVAFEPSPAR